MGGGRGILLICERQGTLAWGNIVSRHEFPSMSDPCTENEGVPQQFIMLTPSLSLQSPLFPCLSLARDRQLSATKAGVSCGSELSFTPGLQS